MNYLNLVKSVMRRLREEEPTTISGEYTTLIGDFINETKREVEDSWNWIQLRSTYEITTVASTSRYTLTGAGNRYRILQVLNSTDDYELRRAGYKQMNVWLNNNNQTNGDPHYYDINGQTGNSPNMDLYPVPNSAQTIYVNMILPQEDLIDDSDELMVPDWPVILGAYAMAISERGDDSSTQYAEAMQRYQKALSDTIAIDSSGVHDEMTWVVV